MYTFGKRPTSRDSRSFKLVHIPPSDIAQENVGLLLKPLIAELLDRHAKPVWKSLSKRRPKSDNVYVVLTSSSGELGFDVYITAERKGE